MWPACNSVNPEHNAGAPGPSLRQWLRVRYTAAMKIMLEAFWRALVYCLHPRVIMLSLLPLALMVAAGLAFGQWGWWPAVDTVQRLLEGTTVQTVLFQLFDWVQLPQLKAVVPSLVVVMAITPLIVIISLLVVSLFMTPALVRMVEQRRFPRLERKHGAGFVGSVFWALGHTVLALLLLLLSLPFWLIPPLVLVVPPLIWGWLSYRLMSFDAWAEHASKAERRQLMQQYRLELLAMGIITGLMGAAPSVVWASTALFIAAFVVLIPVAIWIYALVFAFSSLWFSHFCLHALQQLRAGQAASQRPAPGATMDVTARDITPKPLPFPPSRN